MLYPPVRALLEIAAVGLLLFPTAAFAEVSDITYYGAQIAYFKKEFSKHSDEIVFREQQIAEIESQKARYLANRTSLSSKSQFLRSQIESLTCKFCI